MYKLLSLLLLASIMYSCAKKNETLDAENVQDYYPMQVGKAIRYRLDSTNYIGYNLNAVVTTYFCRDSVEAKVTDAQGRPGYRVVRSYKKLLTDPAWTPRGSFMVTPLSKSVEVVDDNNFRWIKLQGPVKDGFYWNGNRHIETSNPVNQFLQYWEYSYENIKGAKTYNGLSFPETITIKQANDSTDNGPSGYGDKTYSYETYAKGIGLVQKEYLRWTYQPQQPGSSIPPYREGHGLKITVIAHN
jgi:hypothetical protein